MEMILHCSETDCLEEAGLPAGANEENIEKALSDTMSDRSGAMAPACNLKECRVCLALCPWSIIGICFACKNKPCDGCTAIKDILKDVPPTKKLSVDTTVDISAGEFKDLRCGTCWVSCRLHGDGNCRNSCFRCLLPERVNEISGARMTEEVNDVFTLVAENALQM
jgi:hypothetical protein